MNTTTEVRKMISHYILMPITKNITIGLYLAASIISVKGTAKYKPIIMFLVKLFVIVHLCSSFHITSTQDAIT